MPFTSTTFESETLKDFQKFVREVNAKADKRVTLSETLRMLMDNYRETHSDQTANVA